MAIKHLAEGEIAFFENSPEGIGLSVRSRVPTSYSKNFEWERECGQGGGRGGGDEIILTCMSRISVANNAYERSPSADVISREPIS